VSEMISNVMSEMMFDEVANIMSESIIDVVQMCYLILYKKVCLIMQLFEQS